MAEAVGTVRVDLFANTSEWRDGLNKAQGDLRRFAKETEKIAKGFDKFGRQMSLAVTAPLVLFGGAAVKAAADAQDLQGAFNLSFGRAAADATAWAETTGDAMGRSTQRLEQTAITFNEFFEDFAPSAESSAELSKAFTVLTEDFAAFHDVTKDQAQQALQSGLAGSTKALKKFGIDLTDATVKQRALALGIADGTTELTEQQKVLARASLILEQTSKEQGEVTRSQGEAAEETIRAKEAFAELLVTVGNDLLPVFNEFLQFAHQVLDAFNALDPGTRKAILVFGGLAAAAGPAALAIGGLVKISGVAAKAFGVLTAASVTAAGGVKKLGLSAAGAVGWFVALAPAADAAGKAVADIFYDEDKEFKKVETRAYAVRDALVAQGFGADQATKAVQQLLLTAKGDLSKVNVDAARKILGTGTALKGMSVTATAAQTALKMTGDETFQAEREASALQATIDGLVSSFGNLNGETTYTQQELDRVREAADPVGFAIKEYAAGLNIAQAAGVDMGKAQEGLGKEFVRSVGGLDEAKKAIDRLPPSLRAVVTELDRLDVEKTQQAFAGQQFKDFFSNLKRLREESKNHAERETADFAKFVEDLIAEVDPAENFKRQMAKIGQAFAEGKISAEQFALAKQKAFEETPEGEAQIKALRERERSIGRIADDLADAALEGGKFSDVIKQMIKDLIKVQFVKPAFESIIGGLLPAPGSGGGGFNFGSIVSGIGNLFNFGGTRDRGGDAYPGMSYKIGSGVREVFTPAVPGHISRPPPGQMGGGVTVVQHIQTPTLGDFRNSRRQIARDAQRRFQAA